VVLTAKAAMLSSLPLLLAAGTPDRLLPTANLLLGNGIKVVLNLTHPLCTIVWQLQQARQLQQQQPKNSNGVKTSAAGNSSHYTNLSNGMQSQVAVAGRSSLIPTQQARAAPAAAMSTSCHATSVQNPR